MELIDSEGGGGACMTYINSTEQVDGITIFTAVFRLSMGSFFNQCSNSPANVYNLKKNTLIWVSSDYLRDVMRLRRDNRNTDFGHDYLHWKERF